MSKFDKITDIIDEVVNTAATKDIISELFAEVAASARMYDVDIQGEENLISDLIRGALMTELKHLKEPSTVEMSVSYGFVFTDKNLGRAYKLMLGYYKLRDVGNGAFHCKWQDLPEIFNFFTAHNVHVITK